MTADCSPAAVWALLADVTTWSSWAGFHEAEYVSPGSREPHGVGAVRRFRVGRLESREEVLAFDPNERLTYDYHGSLPVKDYVATVSLSDVDDNDTVITWRCEFVAKVPGTGPALRVFMSMMLTRVAKRLAAAAASAQRRQPGLAS